MFKTPLSSVEDMKEYVQPLRSAQTIAAFLDSEECDGVEIRGTGSGRDDADAWLEQTAFQPAHALKLVWPEYCG